MDSQFLGGSTMNALKDLLTMPDEESDSDDDFKVCAEDMLGLFLCLCHCQTVQQRSVTVLFQLLTEPHFKVTIKVKVI